MSTGLMRVVKWIEGNSVNKQIEQVQPKAYIRPPPLRVQDSKLHSTLHMSNKLILVLGATGAQGQAVIDSLLAPTSDGKPSPYTVRALTRDPSNRRAQELAKQGCEVVQGVFISGSLSLLNPSDSHQQVHSTNSRLFGLLCRDAMEHGLTPTGSLSGSKRRFTQASESLKSRNRPRLCDTMFGAISTMGLRHVL